MEAFMPLLILRSQDYTSIPYTLLLVFSVVSSVAGLRYAMNRIPLAIAYLIWTSLGIVGTVIVGVTWLDESLTTLQMMSIVLIVTAVIGLRINSEPAKSDG